MTRVRNLVGVALTWGAAGFVIGADGNQGVPAWIAAVGAVASLILVIAFSSED